MLDRRDLEWQLLEEKLVRFLREHTEWQTFRFIAETAFGDPELEAVLSSIAELNRKRFVVHQGVRVKLSSEEVERIAATLADPSEPRREGEHVQAAEAVRRYAEQLAPIRVIVGRVGSARKVGSRFLHEVFLADEDEDRRFIDDTPVTLKTSSNARIDGFIAGTSRTESLIYVAFDYEVLMSDLPGSLEIHRNRLWHELSDNLSMLPGVPRSSTILHRKAGDREIKLDNGKSLALDLSSLGSPWARLLWGPPGSGKTYCLGWLAAYLSNLRKAGRILVVAPSNVAVDAATREVVKAFETQWMPLVRARRIVRYGYPRDEEILARPELLGPEAVEKLSNAIYEKDLQVKRMRQQRAPESEIAAARAELKQLETERKTAVVEHLKQASVVLTTIASVCQQGSAIRESGQWDTVIADECSMLNGALALFLSSLAERRYLLAGDPRQLAPIFEWNRGEAPDDVKRWLSRDPFEIIEFSTGEGVDRIVKERDPRVVRLLSQRRCHPAIWETVSHLYPEVRPEVPKQKLDGLAQLHPLPGSPVVYFDVGTSSRVLRNEYDTTDAEELAALYESACRKSGRSWENPSTARIAIDLALDIRGAKPDARVSIIAPYRAQVRLIQHWLDEDTRANVRSASVASRPIFVGTVHSYQGGESDVVLFDMVDGFPRTGPGTLLRGDTAMRLVNVALTRARGKLILILNRRWILERCKRQELGLLWDLVSGTQMAYPTIEVHPPSLAQASRDSAQDPLGGKPESPIEEMFLTELKARRNDLPPFQLQLEIRNEKGRLVSRADFAFPKERLAIYCDGARFHLIQDRWHRDQRQRRELARLGWQLLVFPGRDIHNNVVKCVQEVVDYFRFAKSRD